MNKQKVVLYESDRMKAQRNGSTWYFEPAPYERLARLLDFLLHEEPKDEREVRVTALLAGEIICSNLSAFKLVHLGENDETVHLDLTYDDASTLQEALDALADNAASELKCTSDKDIRASCQQTISACVKLYDYIGKEKADG